MKARIETTASKVMQLSPNQRLCFLLGCAERVAPFYRLFASPKSSSVLDEALVAGWSIAAGQLPTDRARGWVPRLNALSEMDIEDSLQREYCAMIAASILVQSLQVTESGEPATTIRSVCFAAVDLCAECDAVGPPRTVQHDEVLRAGPAVSVELSAQDYTLEVLQSTDDIVTACRQVRDAAIGYAQQLYPMIQMLADENGWVSNNIK